MLDLLLNGGNAATLNGRAGAGPAISLSFVLVAIACGFAALCYAELASMIPIAGSAYTYSYATLGEIFAWIIGWDLILEYAFSNMSVAVGFSAYFNDLLDNLFGFHLPKELSQPIFEEGQRTGAWFNLPAFADSAGPELHPGARRARERARPTTPWCSSRSWRFCLFVFGAMKAVNTGNWHPFMPNGYSGVLTGGAIVFFTYIGFDSVSTAAEECRQPQRDMPIGIFATLLICALLYGSVSLVLTGIANWSTLNNDAPVANALKAIGMNRLRLIVTAGALLGMLSSLLVFQYGQARVWFAMSRDRLLPDIFSRVHPQLQDAAHQHLGGGIRGGHSGRNFRHQLVRRSVEYRNAVRVHSGIGGSYSAAQEAARTAARVPGSLGSFFADGLDRLLPGPDAEPAARDLDSLLRMAGDRIVHLFRLRPETHRGVDDGLI